MSSANNSDQNTSNLPAETEYCVPKNIQHLINKIRDSEIRWKAIYSANWRQAKIIKQQCAKNNSWDEKTTMKLTASNRFYEITNRNLYNILISRDGETALNHLQTIFSLLEKLVKEVHKELYSEREKEINAGKIEILISFLNGGKHYEKITEKLLDVREEPEFRLAKATRNCVIHNGSQVDEKWIEVFEKTRKTTSPYKADDELYEFGNVEQIEKWHEILLRIAGRMEIFLLRRYPSH